MSDPTEHGARAPDQDQPRAGGDQDPPDETPVDYPLIADEVPADQVSLGRRLHDPRTIISIVLPLALIVLIALSLRDLDIRLLTDYVLAASPLLLLAAFTVYYMGFPLRGYRWLVLLRGTGMQISLRDSTEIIFISWLVNCLVPAKLGDVYRAYLLRANFTVSLSRTFGTVFIERVFDLFAIVLLGLAAGFWSFRTGLSDEVRIVFGVGLVVIAALAIGLYTVRNFGRRLVVRLPLPHRVIEFYDRFEEGVFAVAAHQVPRLAVVTALIWATEATRLYLVVLALGFDFPLGISGAFFVALIASLLTAVPFTPAGLGLVEAGVVGILTIFYGATATEAGAIALVDRSISVLSIIVLGGITYVLSPKTKRGAQPSPTGSAQRA
jgi:glycosyltransferase 2 family protein